MFFKTSAIPQFVVASLLLVSALLMTSQHSALAEEKPGSTLPDFISLWNFGDPAATRNAFNEILPLAEESGDTAYLAELLTQIARTHGLESDFEEAHDVLDRVMALLKDPGNREMEKPHLRYLLERGRSFNSADEKEKAEVLFLEAYELGLTTEFDGLTIDAAHMLGIVYEGDESVAWNLKALELAKATKDEKAAKWQGSLYNNLGWTYMDSEEYEKALEMFQSGVKYREANGHSEDTRMIAHWSVARALRALDKPDEAYSKLTEIRENFDFAVEDGFWHEEMGEVMLLLGKEDAGLEHLRIALPMLLEMGWVEQYEPERIARLKKLVGSE